MSLVHYENRPNTAKGEYRLIKRDEIRRDVLGAGVAISKGDIIARGSRAVGVGADPRTQIRAGLGSIADAINASKDCPVWNMAVIEQVRWTLLGPQLDANVNANFGEEIDLFGSGKSVPGVDFVETTMAQTGQTQCHFVACYIGLHLEPEPLCWTTIGNAWTHPTTGATQPPSPDVFTQRDRANGALGAAIAAGTQVMIPAVLQWGWWANYAAWHLARGYNLRWRIGPHTNIMDEVARHTAYMPPSAQEGSASSSEVDCIAFIRRLNDRYDALGTALDFLKVNRIRTGSVGAGGANVGNFEPTRDFDLMPATYGGMDLRSMLRGNSEFRKLALPYVIRPGVPIGLTLQQCDTVQSNIMRNYLSITQGLGGSFPPQLTDVFNINAVPDGTAVAPVANERTLDGQDVPQQVDVQRALYKGGDFKIGLMIKGFEVTEDWYNVLAANPDIRDVVMEECGLKFA